MPPVQIPERKEIPAKYCWKTTHLFKSDATWEQARKALLDDLVALAAFKGKLRRGRKTALNCLARLHETHRALARLSNYAHRKYDQDTRVGKYQGMRAVIEKTATEYAEASAYVQPELLALPVKDLRAMIKDPAFAEYDQFLREILRLKPHILTPAQEALLAATGQMHDTGHTVYSAFTAADLQFPEIKDNQGRKVRLSQAMFARYRAAPQRKVRKAAFDAFFGTFTGYQNTLAALLSAQVNANVTNARLRNYGSALEAALDRDSLPVAVYHNMLDAVGRHLPLLHRYLKLRRRLLRLKELRYYDLYPPIIQAKKEPSYTYEQGSALIAEALAPMGSEYVKVITHGMDPRSGWVDPFPNQGKRSGAYMDGSAYDVHPFVLSNFIGTYGSVSTMAHEMGHAMHSYLTNKTQPYAKSDYSIFVAEVASTFNEALLMEHLLRTEPDPDRQLFLLGEQLESFRQTIFRQAMFAEFELRTYELAERKEALTADAINQTYLDVARRYYGHDKGVVQVEDRYGVEWAYVPHFYYNFYVFQYVTGMTAATALAELVLTGGDKARDRYQRHLLQAGSSDQPIRLLKRAGVDLTTTKPYDLAMGVFERTLEQTEQLVG